MGFFRQVLNLAVGIHPRDVDAAGSEMQVPPGDGITDPFNVIFG